MKLEQVLQTLAQRHIALSSVAKKSQQAWAQLERQYHDLLNLHTDDPRILYALGVIYGQTDRGGAAVALLKRAIECGFGGPEAWLNIAASYKNDHKDASAEDAYKQALVICDRLERANEKAKLKGKPLPAHPELLAADRSNALHGMAGLYINAGQPEKVIEWADKALAFDPNDRFALWNKGIGLLEAGRFKEGFELYDRGGFMAGDKPIERKLKTYGGLPKWDGTKGQTVICYGEQGVGDEIMFASMIPDLMRDCRVIIDCDPRLEAMFKRSFPEAEGVYPTSEIDAPFPWIVDHKVDAWVPMGSLGHHYRPDFDSFPRTPYLTADPAKAAKWARLLMQHANPSKFRVGISWAGGLKKTRFDQRSMPLKDWAPILQIPNVEFYSLQYHPQAPDEAAQVGDSLGVKIVHWGDMVADYEETAGFLRNLDLVITVNTSLLHLAGSLGVRTWCLTPVMCAWRYQCKGPNPWYGSVETLRQTKAGDWAPVIADVAGRLADIAPQAKREAA